MPKISNVFRPKEITITPAPGDETTTIAHLAQFCTFEMPSPRDTAPACAAIHAITEQFGWETVEHELDYHGVSWARFRDGSKIRIIVD